MSPPLPVPKSEPVIDPAGVSRRPIDVKESLRWLNAVAAYPKEYGRLSPSAIRMAILIREMYSKPGGFAWFSFDYVEAVHQTSKSSSTRAVSELVKAGFLQSLRKNRHHSNEYVMRFEVVDEVERWVVGAKIQLKARRMMKRCEGSELSPQKGGCDGSELSHPNRQMKALRAQK